VSPARALGLVRRVFSRLCLLVAAASFIAWATGLLIGDRWLWSQFLAYVPPPAWVLAAWLALPAWWLSRDRSRPSARTRALPWALGVLMLLHLAGPHWRLHRLLTPADNTPRDQRLRVMSWNPAWHRMAAFDQRVLEFAPDLLVVGTPHYTADFAAIRAALAPQTYSVRSPTFAVVSVHPIRRWGTLPLNIRVPSARPSWIKPGQVSTEGGEATFFEIDAPHLAPTPLVVWCLDLPSDPFMLRRDVLAAAMAAIRGFGGPVLVRGEDGLDTPQRLDSPGFPAPDLVVGDFNTPRGAGALAALPADLADAYAQAGVGPAGTFPRQLPVLHIDHVLVGPRLRAAGFSIADPGAGRHSAAVAEIVHNK
jgi:hypothetical protein